MNNNQWIFNGGGECKICHRPDVTEINKASICYECYMTPKKIRARLEYLRQEIKAERMSYGELIELQSLAEYIDPGDVELLEWLR